MAKTFLWFTVTSSIGETQDMVFVETLPLGTYRASDRKTRLATSASNVLPDGNVIDPSMVFDSASYSWDAKGVAPTGFSN